MDEVLCPSCGDTLTACSHAEVHASISKMQGQWIQDLRDARQSLAHSADTMMDSRQIAQEATELAQSATREFIQVSAEARRLSEALQQIVEYHPEHQPDAQDFYILQSKAERALKGSPKEVT